MFSFCLIRDFYSDLDSTDPKCNSLLDQPITYLHTQFQDYIENQIKLLRENFLFFISNSDLDQIGPKCKPMLALHVS